MGYSIRPLATLATQARQFFTQAIPGALVRLWANTFTVLGKVFALLDFEHEMRRKWLFDQLFASTAAYQWLTRHGFELGLVPDGGNAASGFVTVPAAAGIIVLAGTQFQRADGATYSTLADTTAAGATINLMLQADTVGAAYDVDAGDTLTVIETTLVPIQLGTTATVDADGITGGTDTEEVETFRARVLYRKRNPPQGGSAPDYVEWAGQALSTVKNVYVDSFVNDTRSVWLCFTVTDQPNGIPTDGEVATVQAYVSDTVRRPITARVFATGPTPIAVPIALKNFAPDTDDTRAAVAAEIAALQDDVIQPATPSTPFTLFVEEIEAAINRATGVTQFTLVSPAADITYTVGGQTPVLQVPTYS
ncbi:baseplate J/gp47 family protein [Beijerinckia sp. L45]|uniref:baseplate J/gp47 family protein n=1 Tax=Beijerinckia sp. L45 TaxID=1641855 RepID=UPI00131D0312|nr:baseplate J/gp47 family protein [Beijerinckia sp. L45]